MTLHDVSSYAHGEWIAPGPGARPIHSAVTGEVIAEAGGAALDFDAMLAHGRGVGGPALRAMGFHDRAKMVKAMAAYLNERREALYELSYDTGATLADSRIDIDGGIGAAFVFASKARRELPDGQVHVEGEAEQLGREGQFIGQHILTPLQGAALHINAFNFPVWGMLEKLAPTLLAGVPAIVKPATATSYVASAALRMIVESGILPDGAVQMAAGDVGGLLDRLGAQDAVAFTGSAATALKLRGHERILSEAVRFTAEQDSLNASILGPDAAPGTPEFDLFVKEAHREITAKAGQKCTAIRRIIAPDALVQPLIEALGARLGATRIGDPRDKATRMGALVSAGQRDDVAEKVAMLRAETERVFDGAAMEVHGADAQAGAFLAPILLHCADPDKAERVHDTEAFGPVSTVMGYRDLGHAVELANRGGGSLVASVVTNDPEVAREVALGAGAWHGRLYFNNRASMAEATGHGAPLPHMIHGGPGRAGGGEEQGGARAILHYMQRTAVQGSPDILTAITGQWRKGAEERAAPAHPFTRRYGELEIGETIRTEARTVTMKDIEHFAEFTGDKFYAHMDEEAAKANPFFPGRVAHGYLLLSFAAGLFVQPDPGPVLANTGLEGLRFLKPVAAGDAISVRLTVMRKTRRTDEYGEVRWAVGVFNQDDDAVAEYTLLTMNAF